MAKPLPLALKVTRSTLILNIAVGVIRMMAGFSFWWTVAQGYILLLLAGCEFWFEPSLRRKPWLRQAGIVAVIGGLAWFSWAFVFARAPLVAVAQSLDTNYQPGNIVDGISWQAGYSELRFSLENATDLDYSNVELSVRPDRLVRRAVTIGDYPGCIIGSPNGPIGNASITPVDGPGGKPIGFASPVVQVATSRLTVRCEHLPHHTLIRFFAATSMPDNPLPEDEDKVTTLYSDSDRIPDSPRGKSNRVQIKATYEALGKVRHMEVENALKLQSAANNGQSERSPESTKHAN